ncbi:MAG: ABC transporter ATP-binding protein [Ruminococcaceae bacterium]|nr:ABC transporter ATP-binding protein [Oscillospiraceae bacterium]
MKNLFKYLSPYKLRIAGALTIKAIGTVMDLFIPWLLAVIIDDIIPTENLNAVIIYGILMVVCSFCAVLFNIMANRSASRVSSNCIRAIRHDLFEKISYLDASQIDEFSISSLESRITTDTYNVQRMVNVMQRMAIRAAILFIGGLVITTIQDPFLTLTLLCTLPFIAFFTVIITKKSIPLYTEQQKSADNLIKVVRENASGVRIIKALNRTEYEKDRFEKANKEAIKKEKKANLTVAATNPIISFFLNLGLSAVIVVGALMITNHKSSVGNIISFIQYFTIISNAMIAITRVFVSYSNGAAAMNRINEVLASEPSLWVEAYRGVEDENAEENIENSPHIEFSDVSFAYEKHNVLQNISFSVSRGETLGIIGGTGCGKSTLISLLMRIYDTNEGEIKIDGKNIKEIPTEELRSRFGSVFQNDFIFKDSIKENVMFGRDISQEKLEKAFRLAQAYDFVNEYPEKSDYMLDIKGANLSGGQKQRLTIARAIAGDPEILILDDASSALDYKTDAALRRAIKENYQSTTTVIVSQRVSSIMHANLILVLEEGKIIGSGTHEELLLTCEYYRDTAKSQMGGVILD